MRSDSVWTVGDSNAINGTEFYRIGTSVPGRTVAMKELGYDRQGIIDLLKEDE